MIQFSIDNKASTHGRWIFRSSQFSNVEFTHELMYLIRL